MTNRARARDGDAGTAAPAQASPAPPRAAENARGPPSQPATPAAAPRPASPLAALALDCPDCHAPLVLCPTNEALAVLICRTKTCPFPFLHSGPDDRLPFLPRDASLDQCRAALAEMLAATPDYQPWSTA